MARRSLVPPRGRPRAGRPRIRPVAPRSTPKPEAAKAPEAATSRPKTRSPGRALRVQIVIARYQGEKKLASVPYTFAR